MILYLDTSAYIKLFIEESGTEAVQNAAAQAEVLASHVIAYAEMRAAIGRMRREDRLTGNDAASVKRRFERHWKSVLRFIPEEPAIRQAGSFAERFGLKGYDSVHLACAFLLHKQSSMPLQFACFDFPLNKAALRLGFQVVTGVESGSNRPEIGFKDRG